MSATGPRGPEHRRPGPSQWIKELRRTVVASRAGSEQHFTTRVCTYGLLGGKGGVSCDSHVEGERQDTYYL